MCRFRRTLPLVALALCWAALFAQLVSAGNVTAQAEDLTPLSDALIPPPPSPALAGSFDQRGLSQFMAGSVAVRVVLPESHGRSETSTEDWTSEQIAAVRAEVERGLSWWAEQLPLAGLSFSIDLQVVETSYEPISHSQSEEGLWIGEALANLGAGGSNYFDRAYDSALDLREHYDSDWATTIFVVNSEHDANGRFPDDRFAYAYIGGPFMVLTSDVGPYGSGRLGAVLAHELGHIFGALDQYPAAHIPCQATSGYLNAPTSNSQVGGCPTSLPSIMLEIMPAFSSGAVDPSAQAQVGYRDSDGDGIIDPLETTPQVQLLAGAVASTGQRPRLSGGSSDQGFPSPSQQIISLNHIARVEYRADGGPWQYATPDDGAFDSADEGFSFEPPLYDGSHLIELRAVNNMGNSSPLLATSVTISGLGSQPAYRASAPQLTNLLALPLDLAAPTGTQGLQVSEDPLFRGASWQPLSSTLTYQLAAGSDGARTLYVRFRDAAGLSSLAYPLPVLLDTQPPEGTARLRSGTPSQLLLEAHDEGSGAAAIQVVIDGSAGSWQTYQPELNLDMTGHLVGVRLRDGAGNTSAEISAQTTGTLYLPLINVSR